MHGNRRMVGGAVTTSALQLVFSLADQREFNHLAFRFAKSQAKSFELDPHPLDLTCNSQNHGEDLAPGTFKQLTLLLRNSAAPCVLELAKRASRSKHGADPFLWLSSEAPPLILSASEASSWKANALDDEQLHRVEQSAFLGLGGLAYRSLAFSRCTL